MKIERLSNSLAEFLGQSLQYSSEQISVLAYGLFGLIQTILSIIIVTILGFTLGITLESLILSFSIAILRKFSGGAHATSAERCLILGTLFSILGALLSHLISNIFLNTQIYVITCILFIWSFFITYQNAPIDSPNKPIKNFYKQQKLKQRSLLVVFIYFTIVSTLFFIASVKQSPSILIYSICLTLGMSWQVFTITKLGHKIAQFLDNVLIYISNT